MFTIEQIKAAHAKVKSGADFPKYIQELKALGVTSYDHYVYDGHIDYPVHRVRLDDIEHLRALGSVPQEPRTRNSDQHVNYPPPLPQVSFRAISSEAKWPEKAIAVPASPEKLMHDLKIHQLGKTDYPTFCQQAADAGVEKWTVDIDAMKCTYYDKEGKEMLAEDIPVVL